MANRFGLCKNYSIEKTVGASNGGAVVLMPVWGLSGSRVAKK